MKHLFILIVGLVALALIIGAIYVLILLPAIVSLCILMAIIFLPVAYGLGGCIITLINEIRDN